jgi:PAS domain S-box-containing protein
VIHVSDDDVRRAHVTPMLREAGFEVVEAEDGTRALELARTLAPDVVVAAVRMRDVDGFELCRQIRAHPAIAAIPVVLLSAHFVADEHRAHGLDMGADAYLAEPVAPDVLRATLHAVLRARRAEGEAGEAAARERFLFDSLPVPAWVFDRDSAAFLAVNDAAVKRLGYSREELLEMSIVDLRPAEDVPVLREVLARQNADVTGSWRLLTRDGELLEVELVARSIVFGGRNARLVVMEDVTERKRMQTELAAVKARLAADLADMRSVHDLSARLADVTRSVGSALDLDAVLQHVVDGARDLCGSDFAAILVREDGGDGFRPCVRAGGAARTRQRELRVEAGRGAGGQVILTRRPFRTGDYLNDPRISPDYRWVAERSGIVSMMIVPIVVDDRVEALLYLDNQRRRPFNDEQEALCLRLADHAAVAIHNVRLFRAERAARAEAEVLKALAVELSMSLDPGRVLQRVAEAARDLCRADLVRIALREADGAMIYRSIVGARATGYEQLRLRPGKGFIGRVLETGRAFRTADAPSDPHVHPDYGRRIIEAEGTRTAMVVPIVAGDRIEGVIYVARRTPAPFSDDDERVGSRLADHAAIAIRNAELLAREQAARSDAEEANRAKDQFLAVLSHELRTPLNTMLGWLAVVRTGRLDASQHQRALEIVERNTRAQARMIDDLLDISRIAAGKMVLDRRPISLASVIADTVDALQPEVKAKGLTLERHVDAEAGTVSADADRIRQTLVNLLVNAMKYTPSGGRVEVRLRAGDGVVRITVQDTGTGIEPDVLPHVFERFRQADWRTAGAQGGLGLGLAVVREVVQMHGGSVEAQSDGPGRGATFTVTLPVIRRP